MPHDGPGEHYHDIGDRVSGQDDSVVWTTVGIDIGSSTSQVVFSRITLARDDAYYVVVDRAILHQSEVILTPYATADSIDQQRLALFIEREFAAAHLTRPEIHTGAVIMTGLALSTANARAIAEAVADDSGAFIAVSAGDLLEARLAANAAGLPQLSADHAGIILHIDIGGGTTKLSTWEKGKLLRLAAIDVGARLITVDPDGRMLRIEAPLGRLAERLGIALRVGVSLSDAELQALGSALAAEILRYGGLRPEAPLDPALLRTTPLFADEVRPKIQAVIFSGGVSEYIYHRERRAFGDLGGPLGRAVRAAIDISDVELIQSDCGIRATVLGASQHSVQLSGNTIFVSDPSILPLRNLPVVLPSLALAGADLDATIIAEALADALALHVAPGAGKRSLGLAIRWEGSPTLQRLDAVAAALVETLTTHFSDRAPCVVIVDGDVAGLLGSLLDRHCRGGRPVICLDGVQVHEFDHIDIGEMGRHSRAVPVVVKSLVFAPAPEHLHVHH